MLIETSPIGRTSWNRIGWYTLHGQLDDVNRRLHRETAACVTFPEHVGGAWTVHVETVGGRRVPLYRTESVETLVTWGKEHLFEAALRADQAERQRVDRDGQ
jgi:hypothetical protein